MAEALVCPSCAARHEAGERFCDSCGMPLVHADGEEHEPGTEARARARKIDPVYTSGELVRVAGARHQAEAEMIQNILLEEGVPSVLRRSAGFDVPDFLAAGPRDVLVPESGERAARDVLLAAEIAASPVRSAPAVGRRESVRLALCILAGGALAALVAWALLQAAG